jgi:hypothetical protein
MDLLLELQILAVDAWAFARSEVGIVGGGGLGAGGLVSGSLWAYQRHHARSLPMLPSHADALGDEANAGTRFFAAVHDLTMTVTEAWNMVRARGKGVEELIRRDHLQAVVQRVDDGAEELLTVLDPYAASHEDLVEALRAVRGLWTYRSKDNYRTETYTVTTRDSEGRSRTETRTRQVYENTDHWFTFTRSGLPKAEKRTKAWARKAVKTRFPTLDLHDRRIELDELDPTQRSFLERLVKSTVTRSDDDVSDAQLEDYANQWIVGTRMCRDLRSFVHNAGQAHASAADLFETTRSAEARYHFRTTSRSHSGPRGYGAMQSLIATLAGADRGWRDVVEVVKGAQRGAHELLEQAMDASVVESDMDYAETAVKVYQLAFPDSELELDRLPSGWLTWGSGVGVAVAIWAVYGVFLLLEG